MISCTECGHENRDTSLFCTSCGTSLSQNEDAGARLVFLGEETARVFQILGVERLVGRDTSNDLVLEDGEVSGMHLKVVSREDQFFVEDLASTNGTFVNGRQIQGRIVLRDGDLIKLGQTILKFVV